MAKKKQVTVPPDKLALYQRLLKSIPGADERSNFGSAYTAINGNMYSMISKHGVVGIRLPQPDRDEFIKKYKTELFRGDPAWPPAKEYVAVPDELLSRTAVLRPYLKLSLAYTRSLKPKTGSKKR